MPTKHDCARLARAVRNSIAAENTRKSVSERVDHLDCAILALQSLDDLGSEEENQGAWDEMLRLEAERARLLGHPLVK